jgi:hypothetical protein
LSQYAAWCRDRQTAPYVILQFLARGLSCICVSTLRRLVAFGRLQTVG